MKNMKNMITTLLTITLIFSLTACQNQQSEDKLESTTPLPVESALADTTPTAMNIPPKSESTPKVVQEGKEAGGILIAYFSRWGNTDYPDDVDASTSASITIVGNEQYGTTEYAAKLIQQKVGGDLHLIQTTEPYSTDFDAVVDRNHKEMNADTLPPLVASDLDVSKYDTVFIGYPVWATNAPQAIFSFLSQYDLSGKTIIPFCTHDGYGAGGSYGDIAEAIPDAKQVLGGLALEAPDVPSSADAVTQWLNEIGINGKGTSAENTSETPITITVGDTVLKGVLYDTLLSNEIREKFPLTVSMVGYGGREFYGGIDFTPKNIEGGQLNFKNGDITYCSRNNTMAIFYAQTDRPNLTMEVIPIGKVTSDLSVFQKLSSNAKITFALVE